MKKAMVYRILVYVPGLLFLAIAVFVGKSVGFTKNCFDLFNHCLG